MKSYRAQSSLAKPQPERVRFRFGRERRCRSGMAIRWSLLIGVLLSPSLVVTPVQSAFPGTNGIIIVDKGPRGHGDGHWGHELYTINPDGSNLTRLTHSESFVYNRQPTWSPNGQLIAYTEKSAADRYRIVVIDPKGNEVDATSSSNGSGR